MLQYKKSSDGASYKICGQNADGKTFYQYDSAAGGSVKQWTGAAGATLADCVT